MSDISNTCSLSRATRAQFWPAFIPYLVLLGAAVAMSVTQPSSTVTLILPFAAAAYLFVIRQQAEKRMHDVGVSCFFYRMLLVVWVLVLAVNIAAAIVSELPAWLVTVHTILFYGVASVLHVALLVFFLLPSQDGTNDYGDNPLCPGKPFTGTSWGGIIEDMLKLLLVMGTLGFCCNLAMKPFEQTSVTDSLVSLIRKGALETDKKTGEEIDHVYLRELTAGVATDKNFVNTEDGTGRTPLMWAVYANYNNPKDALTRDLARLYYVQNLLSQPGINVQAKDKDGFTAMHWAAWSGMPYCTLLLAEAGLDINAQENNGYTPLMLAAQRGNNEVVKMLLTLGADATLKNSEGKTAAEMVAASEGAYNKRDTFMFTLIFSPEREKAYKETLALLATRPASRSLAELMDDMARMSGEARANRIGAAILEPDKQSGLTILLQTVQGAAQAANAQEYDEAIHYFVLGQIKAIAEQEAKLAKAGKPVASSAVTAKTKDGKNALDLALQYGLQKTASHLSTVLQPTAAPVPAPAVE